MLVLFEMSISENNQALIPYLLTSNTFWENGLTFQKATNSGF